jgi:hypothetical protein
MSDNVGPLPQEAIDYLDRKNLRPAFSYQDVWREEHNHAFTVAKAMDLDLLSDIRESLTTAMSEGKPFRQWRNEMADNLSRRGWWGRQEVTDPETGDRVVAQLGSSRRLKTIWDVNLGQAYQAGVWERGHRSASHPYVMYRVGASKEHRPEHLSWDGLILPKDDPFWSTHNPRNGWGCKCTTRFVSEAQFQRYQRSGIPAPVQGDGQPGRKPIQTTAPTRNPREYRNKRTGETYTGYEGIDPGFEHNAGVGRMEQLGEIFREKDVSFTQTVSPAGPAGTRVSDALNVRVLGDLGDATRQALRAIESVHGDGPLPKIDVARSQAKSYYGAFSFYPDGTANKIKMAGGPHPEMTAAHEVGHFIDHNGLPGTGFESVNQSMPEMRRVIDRIRDTDTVRGLSSIQDPKFRRYLQSNEELWARAYSQYIAWKSGNQTMKDQLDTTLQSEHPGIRLQQWTHDEFVPIAQEIDTLFEVMGWLKKD